jgi:hypothetical protein
MLGIYLITHSFFFFFFAYFLLAMLGIRPRTLCARGKYSTTELYPQPSLYFLNLVKADENFFMKNTVRTTIKGQT